MSAYYHLLSREEHPDGGVTAHYEPTKHAQGVWNPHEQHMAPATGVLCAELERFAQHDDLRIARINLDIWGLISLTPFSIDTRVIRPGRTIELLEARMQAQGKTCVVARAWRLQSLDTAVIAGLEDPPIPTAEHMQNWDTITQWGGGYLRSLSFKTDPQQQRPGRGIAWLKNDLDMVTGQPTSAFVRLMGMVDTSNGVAARVDGREWVFPNVDLNINLLRMPQGEWLGLATQQQYGADGVGLTTSVLHDVQGVFGHSEQTLTLRPNPMAAKAADKG